MITLSISNYNRSSFVIESFLDIINEDTVSEIVINDDCSNIDIFDDLYNKIKNINNKKIKIFRNDKNYGAFLNKLKAVQNANNEYVILLDSDNIITKGYIDNIPKKLYDSTIYLPDMAICSSKFLDYSFFSNKIIDINEYINIVKNPIIRNINTECLLNTGNYLFNKYNYIKCILNEKNLLNPYAGDAFYLIYLWFKNIQNTKLHVVKDMRYIHRLHDNKDKQESSWYIKNSKNTNKFISYLRSNIENLIKNE